jgi:outer membrane protein OmpA-like peptidoglycan-associated protein
MLQEMARLVSENPDLGRISIEGHTDSRGSDQYNLKLSEIRAASVLQFLVAQGVPIERLTSAGFGESRPIRDNDTEEHRSQNRRVEFRLTN